MQNTGANLQKTYKYILLLLTIATKNKNKTIKNCFICIYIHTIYIYKFCLGN